MQYEYSYDYTHVNRAATVAPVNWLLFNASVDQGVASPLAPDSTSTADGIIASAGSANHGVHLRFLGIDPDTGYRYGVYLHADSMDWACISITYYNAGGDYIADIGSFVDVTNGTFGDQWSVPVRSVSYRGNGWYFVEIDVVSPATTSQIDFAILLSPENGVTTFVGDGSSTCSYVWNIGVVRP